MSGFTDRNVRGVDVMHWVSASSDATSGEQPVENLGDYLGSAIAEELADRSSGDGNGARLLTAGSVLQAAEPGDVVWGSGLNLKLSRPVPASATRLDYRAVRGPLTRAALLLLGADVPDVLGDPVSLLPEVFPEVREWVDPQRPITIVPNLNDLGQYGDVPGVVSPVDETWSVIRAIAESEFVVGSSLHAVIIAEALGIPARFLLSPVEHPWKYHDYLLATGRSKERFASTVDEALELGGHAPPDLDLAALASSFPNDLWGAATSSIHPDTADAAHTLDLVTHLLGEEFDDVHRPDRGGAPMAWALVRLIGLPAVRTHGHRLRRERLGAVASAVQQLIGDQAGSIEVDDVDGEVLRLLTSGSHDSLSRLSLRNARGSHAHVVSASLDEDRFEWTFHGVGLGPIQLAPTAGARAVLLHEGDGIPLPTERLAIAADYPDFRWSLSLRLDDIPAGVSHFGLRIDAETDSGWIRGPRVARVAGLRPPRFLALRGELDWRLQREAIAARERLDAGADATRGAGNVRTSSDLVWLGEAAPIELSVVVTTHNVAPWLDETLYSILRQDVPSMEVIVVDDHSDDETRAVIDRFRHDVRLVPIDAIDRGGANARDVGAAVASGRFLIFADGDDLVPDGAYETLVNSLRRSDSDIAIGNFNKFSPSDIWRPARRWNLFTNAGMGVQVRDVPDLIRNRAVWNRAFRRDFWDGAGLTFPEVARSNDIVPMTRALLCAERVDIIDRDVYLYRDRPGQTSMTSQSSSTAGLVSYLTQELECVELISGDGDAALLATMTSLFVGADGWAHLHRTASQGADLPPEIAPLVDAILAAFPPELVARQAADRRAVVRLIALGRCDAATAILRHRDEPRGQDALDLLRGWLEALEYLPKLTPDDDAHTAWYRGFVGSALECVAKGSPGPEVRDDLRRALEARPPDVFLGVPAAALEYALRAETRDDFDRAMRLLAGRHTAQPDESEIDVATIDDWLVLLNTMDGLTHDQERLTWRDRITPLLESSIADDVPLDDDQWTRIVTARRNSVTRHHHRGVRRAAPIVAIYDDFGPQGVSTYLTLREHGVMIDRCTLRRGRLHVDGSLPTPVPAGLLALRVQRDGHTVASFPVTVNKVGSASRWSASIDLTLVPLDGSPTVVAEAFRGVEGWFYLRVPLHITEDAMSQSDDLLTRAEAAEGDDVSAVHVAGLPGVRRHVHDVDAGLRRIARRRLGQVRQAVRRS